MSKISSMGLEYLTRVAGRIGIKGAMSAAVLRRDVTKGARHEERDGRVTPGDADHPGFPSTRERVPSAGLPHSISIRPARAVPARQRRLPRSSTGDLVLRQSSSPPTLYRTIPRGPA